MYFNTTFFDEKYNPKSVQLICEKCGEYIEVDYNNEYISKAQSEYCVVTNGEKIRCKCGNQCQNGLIEPKKERKVIHIQKSNIQSNSLLNKPKCPICQSTNLSKITTAKKVMKIAAFGIFGMGDNGKTWKCNSCGSRF